MRTRDKQRIFKRFMEGDSLEDLWNRFEDLGYEDIEQAIRDCIKEKEKNGYPALR